MAEGHDLCGHLTAAGHELRQRVYFEDTDFSGLVYHARYLHFFERGRSDYLRLLGVHHNELAADGLAFAVKTMALDFKRPARIDDILTIVTEPGEIGGARIRLRQAIARGETILVTAAVEVALVNAGGKPQRLPLAVRAAFEAQSQPRGDGRSVSI
jgi:acyl-CoA thioester hydrolase